jgi:NAD+ kinase
MLAKTKINFNKIAIIYSDSAKSLELAIQLKQLYSFCQPEEAEIIIVIGGDGELLHTIHRYMDREIAFYGINSGNIGFLMNSVIAENLMDNLQDSIISGLHPLKMQAETIDGEIYQALAINEVSIFRKTNQAAKFKIYVDQIERMSELVADGAMVSTSAGSSAYNLSAGGPILPLESNMLCLTPICPFRPRRWHGALLPFSTIVKFEILESSKRPVNVAADFQEFNNIKSVIIKSVKNKTIKLLFDKKNSLENRIIKEQFSGHC